MPTNRRALISLAAAVLLALPCAAQCGPLAWSEANAYPGVYGLIYASTLWDPDGPGPLPTALAVVGGFTLAGAEPAGNAAWWDGSRWHGLGAADSLPATLDSVVSFNGSLVAATSSNVLGGSNVVRWTGSSWQPLGTGVGVAVRALGVYNGELYCGGSSASTAIFRWDGVAWQQLPPHSFNLVNAFAVHNGQLVVGGSGGQNIATWNGTSWGQLGGGVNAQVTALTVHGGDLIAGGEFAMAGGSPAARVARWNGSSWTPQGPGLPAAPVSLAVWNGFLTAAAENAPSFGATAVYRWDGLGWPQLGVSTGGRVNTLTAFGSQLYALGSLSGIGGISAVRAARWTGAAWARVGAGFDRFLTALAVHGGDLIAGGSFTIAGDADARGIARFDGAAWHPLGSGLVASGGAFTEVRALATFNADLVIGGTFVTAGSAFAPNIARWDGANWSPLGPGFAGYPDGTVRALAVHNGQLVAGGIFTQTITGTPLNYVAGWTGFAWQALGGGMDGPVTSLCVYNGDLYAGGSFSTAGGVAAANIAKWNGVSWQPVGGGVAGAVNALQVYNGELVVGGNFGSAGAVPVVSIARWNGLAWQALPGAGNNSVTQLGVYAGELYAASSGWAVPSGYTTGLARWNGSSWASLGSGVTGQLYTNPSTPAVDALAAYRGALFVGGGILTAGGVVSPYLARWSPPLPLLSVTQPGPGLAAVGNAWLIPGHEYYNLASFTLCPGGPGTGPWGGLCAADPGLLWDQVSLPVGVTPFHFVASSTTTAFGPYALPPGLSFEAISVDGTGGAPGCISEAIRHTVQ